MIMEELEKILNKNERIIWQGKPQKRPFLLRYLLHAGFFIGLAFIGFGLFVMLLAANPLATAFLSIFVLFGFIFAFGPFIYAALVYPHVRYAITDKRVILQGGVIGRDFDFADYDKMESATVNVGVIDKVFGKNSGSILVYAGRLAATSTSQGSYTINVPFMLAHINEPYSVFEKLKKISFDVKADIQFPNILRPEENVGYRTKYKPK